jgi:hypothetical protein
MMQRWDMSRRENVPCTLPRHVVSPFSPLPSMKPRLCEEAQRACHDSQDNGRPPRGREIGKHPADRRKCGENCGRDCSDAHRGGRKWQPSSPPADGRYPCELPSEHRPKDHRSGRLPHNRGHDEETQSHRLTRIRQNLASCPPVRVRNALALSRGA